MNSYFITFRSVTLAQRGERSLRRGGMECVLQRTPRWMEERGCGYCLRVRPADAGKAVARLRGEGVGFSKVFAVNEKGSAEEVTV